jgi:hypothetical protein
MFIYLINLNFDREKSYKTNSSRMNKFHKFRCTNFRGKVAQCRKLKRNYLEGELFSGGRRSLGPPSRWITGCRINTKLTHTQKFIKRRKYTTVCYVIILHYDRDFSIFCMSTFFEDSICISRHFDPSPYSELWVD